MEFEELIRLIDKLDQTTLAYLNYTKGDTKVELSKKAPVLQPSTNQTKVDQLEQAQQPTETVQLSSTSTEEKTETSQSEAEEVKTETKGEPVLSPMVGVAYLQESPEEDPFVQVGDFVEKGETVILVEAMKLMTEIQAHISGVVTEICVEDEEVVEYNQPLIKIRAQS